MVLGGLAIGCKFVALQVLSAVGHASIFAALGLEFRGQGVGVCRWVFPVSYPLTLNALLVLTQQTFNRMNGCDTLMLERQARRFFGCSCFGLSWRKVLDGDGLLILLFVVLFPRDDAYGICLALLYILLLLPPSTGCCITQTCWNDRVFRG